MGSSLFSEPEETLPYSSWFPNCFVTLFAPYLCRSPLSSFPFGRVQCRCSLFYNTCLVLCLGLIWRCLLDERERESVTRRRRCQVGQFESVFFLGGVKVKKKNNTWDHWLTDTQTRTYPCTNSHRTCQSSTARPQSTPDTNQTSCCQTQRERKKKEITGSKPHVRG